MRGLDQMLELGNGFHTRLSFVLGVMPPEAIVMDPPFPDQPTAIFKLKGGLDVVPCYEPLDELNAWLDENAPHLIDLGLGWRVDEGEIVSFFPSKQFEIEAGQPIPNGFLQTETEGLILPIFVDYEGLVRKARAHVSGFFGG